MNKLVWVLLFSASFLVAPLVFAQDSGTLVSSSDQTTSSPKDQQGSQSASTGAKKQHKAPSKASIDACQDKTEGDACQVTTSHGSRPGICSYTSDKKYLFCKGKRKAHSQAKPQAQAGN
jgi:hypothetical protein